MRRGARLRSSSARRTRSSTIAAARSSWPPRRRSCRACGRSTSAASPTACPGVTMIDAAPRARDRAARARGLAGIHSPNTAIVDYGEVAAGARPRSGRPRRDHRDGTSPSRAITRVRGGGAGGQHAPSTRSPPAKLINCAGLYSDVIARLAGAKPEVQIIPFRGEYYFLRPEREQPRARPDLPGARPRVPVPRRALHAHHPRRGRGRPQRGAGLRPRGLPVHDASRPSELAGTLGYRGFWAMARKYWRTGAYEMYRSLSKKAFVEGAAAAGSRAQGRRTSCRAAPGCAPRPCAPTARSWTTSASSTGADADPRGERAVTRRRPPRWRSAATSPDSRSDLRSA